MLKIKFKQFDVSYKNHVYCILIPMNIDNVFVSNYLNDEGTGWAGDRKGIKVLMYSAALLGFNPMNKIIYFPIRNNKCLGDYHKDDYDLIWTTHQVHLKKSEWRDIKKTLSYKRPKTYVLNYDEKRTEAYFERNIALWKNTNAQRKKEYAIETVQEDTLFQIFSRRLFQQIYLDLHRFLQQNLETDLINNTRFNGGLTVPFTYMDLDYVMFPFRKKKQIEFWPFIDFYDAKVERRVRDD